MADIPNGTPIPVFAIDRTAFPTRAAMVATVKFHIKLGSIVQIEDSQHLRGDRLVYEVRPAGGGMQLVDPIGRQIGVFADVAAMVAHAEAVIV